MSHEPTQPSPTAVRCRRATPAHRPRRPGAPVPVASGRSHRRARSGGILNLLLIGAAIVAIGGVAFAIGRSTAPADALTQVGAFP